MRGDPFYKVAGTVSVRRDTLVIKIAGAVSMKGDPLQIQ